MADFWQKVLNANKNAGNAIEGGIKKITSAPAQQYAQTEQSSNPLAKAYGYAENAIIGQPLKQAGQFVLNPAGSIAGSLGQVGSAIGQSAADDYNLLFNQPSRSQTAASTQPAAAKQASSGGSGSGSSTPTTPTESDFINQFVNQYMGANNPTTALSAALQQEQPGIDASFTNEANQANQAYTTAGNRIQSMYNALANDISTNTAPAQAAQYDQTNKALASVGQTAQNTINGAYGSGEAALASTLKNLGISDAQANVIAQDPSGTLQAQQAGQVSNAANNQARAQTQNTQGKQSEGTFNANMATSQKQMGVQDNQNMQSQLASLLTQIAGNKQTADANLATSLASSVDQNTPSLTDLINSAQQAYEDQYGTYADATTRAADEAKADQAAQLSPSVLAAMIGAQAKTQTSTNQNPNATDYSSIINQMLKQYNASQ